MARKSLEVNAQFESGIPYEHPVPSVSRPCPNGDWRVSRFRFFVDKHDGKLGYGLVHLCQHLDLGITPSHLSRLFRQEIGLGVREYMKRRRLRAAMHKLQTTTLSVKEIAADLGYRSPADFFRQFKLHVKLTPREFRTHWRRAANPRSEVV